MRCPACGYTTQKQRQVAEVKLIYKEFPDDIKEKLIYIGKKLKPFFNKETLNRQWNQFIYAISIMDYEIIRTTLNQYLLSAYHEDGKGFPYLKAMVHLNEKNYKKHIETEVARFGSNPPLITNEEEE